ncbi:uncharacterized protein [Drosophila bipectinata]|uniref:uncharacterized protein isoform X2 n=1 Tax=Drosophila bipectinata TaxID=42026 RepID=UPI0038B37C5D
MRRSKAPSVRRSEKWGSEPLNVPKTPEPETSPSCSWPSNSPPMEWGTAKGSEQLGPRELKPGENPLKESRIFHILWRNQTTKKHKTWTGNGTLVISAGKMTLKDETGRTIDSMNCFKQRQVKENDQLQIGSKDVEVQEEIKTVEECVAQRKLEIASWCQKIDAKNGYMDDPPPAESPLPFRSHVLKKKMRLESPEKQESLSNPPLAKSTQTEYICLVSPSELQKTTLSLFKQICGNSELDPSVLMDSALDVCDHPVLLKSRVNQSNSLHLMQLLQPHLPPWPEMGIYDSSKFEFVHVMLDDLVVERGQKCCIVANNPDCLRLFKGYCQSWDIAHVEIEDQDQVAVFNSTAEESAMVALILTSQLQKIRDLHCRYLIIYNHNARSLVINLLNTNIIDTNIYTLITAGGCPEEQQFFGNEKSGHFLDDIENHVGEKTNGFCDNKDVLPSWIRMQPPFGEEVKCVPFMTWKAFNLCL